MGIPGRAWWHIDIMRLQMAASTGRTRELIQETPKGLPEVRAQLERCIAEMIQFHGVAREKLIVGGFSQGSMLTTDLALASKDPFAGLAILSGTLLSENVWKAEAARVGKQLHVLMSHGRADPILPFGIAESLKNLFVESGADVEWVPHDGQHEIPPEVLARFSDFARRRLE
jgi:phospholipase/carboxylesterase